MGVYRDEYKGYVITKNLNATYDVYKGDQRYGYGYTSLDQARDFIDIFISIEENAVPIAEWFQKNYPTVGAALECSNCSFTFDRPYNFCPNCGSKMKDYDRDVACTSDRCKDCNFNDSCIFQAKEGNEDEE